MKTYCFYSFGLKAIILFLPFFFITTAISQTSPTPSITLEYLEDNKLWEAGYHAYQANDFPAAAIYLYAYAQRYPDILDLDTQEEREFYAVLQFITQNLEKKSDDLSENEEDESPAGYVIPSETSQGESIYQLSQNPIRSNSAPPKSKKTNTIIDPRDRQVYRVIQLNGKVWLAENLRYNTEGSWCYDNKFQNCKKYGRLYLYESAKKACEGLGEGWHIPTRAEWESLVNSYGGFDTNNAYYALKDNGHSGLDLIITGYRDSKNTFHDLNRWTGFFTLSTQHQTVNLFYVSDLRGYNNDQKVGFSVFPRKYPYAYPCRCVKGKE